MSEYTRTRRWSEVIPPHTALSFAAIWDPDEGMVTFSGGQLLTSDLSPEARSELPRDTDTYSQVLTLDGFSFPMAEGYGYGYGYNAGARSGRVPTVTFTLDALDEGQSVLDPYMRQNAQWRRAEGDDARATHAHKRSGVIHLDFKAASAAVASFRHRLLHPFSPTSEAPDAHDDGYDGFFEDVPVTAGTSTSGPVLVHLNLKSAFSMTDTSTAGYVDIDTPSVYSQATSSYASATPSLTSSLSEKWSTLRSIDVENIASCPNTRSGPRRLRKRRPTDDTSTSKPADPAEVLARAEFNHVRDSSASPSPSTSRSPSTRCKARLAKMMTDLPPLPPLPTQTRSAPPTPQKERPQKGIHRFKSLPKLPRLGSPPPSPVSTSMKGTTGCYTPTTSPTTGATSTPPTSFTQTWRGRRPARANTTGGDVPERGKTLRREKSVTRLVKQSVEILTSRCRRPSTSGAAPCPGAFARECCQTQCA